MSGERTTYQYDFKGNLVGERVYNTLSYTYANQLYEINNNFDDDGNIIKNVLKTQSGNLTTNYGFDSETGLPTNVTLFGGRSVAYNYDDEGTLSGRSLSTSTPVEESFVYNDEGLVSTHTIARGTSRDAYSYTYDDNANITEIKKGDTVQQSYEYDALNQLIRENDRDTGKTVTYNYDGYGNITSKTEYAFTLGELGSVVDTISYAYNDTAWKDKLTNYDGQAITYDEIGNPITYRGATMTWFGRQMMSYSKNGTSISYTYDADGLRTSKTVNGVKHNYYYVDGQLRYERNGDNYEVYYTYDADGRPVLATKRDLVAKKNYQYYLITNTRGDVIETRDGNGNVNAKFVYDAWGKLFAVTDANGNALSTDSFAYQISLKYRGYVYDNETGLYYLQSRYYDAEVSRFLNSDAIVNTTDSLGFNTYAYCGNNPVNCVDPTGYVANFVNSFSSKMKNAWTKGYEYVDEIVQIYEKGALRTFFDAFSFEAGAGFGLGVSAEIGSVGLEAVFKGDPLHFVITSKKGESGLFYTFENSYNVDMIYFEGYYQYIEKTKLFNPSYHSSDEDKHFGLKTSFSLGMSVYIIAGFEFEFTFDFKEILIGIALM